MQIDLGNGNEYDKSHFRELFGGVYEHSSWVADAVFDSVVESPVLDGEVQRGASPRGETPEDAVLIYEALVQRFEQVFLSSSKAQQLEVLRAHPELACRRATSEQLTAASQQEQSGSGLDQCSDIELKQFIEMNNKYMNKNKFPFIIAVKGLSRSNILQLFEKRLANDSETEFEIALQQVNRIARLRIETLSHA